MVTLDGHRWLQGDGVLARDIYLICNSLQEVEDQAASVLRSFPHCDAVIIDSKHQRVREFSNPLDWAPPESES